MLKNMNYQNENEIKWLKWKHSNLEYLFSLGEKYILKKSNSLELNAF